MIIRRAQTSDLNKLLTIVHGTIREVYHHYYPEGVVDFFISHHSMESINAAINNEYILLAEKEGSIIGTGALAGNEIRRMYVLPDYQGCGCGSIILEKLEHHALELGFDRVVLESSLPAYSLYVSKGYTPVKYSKHKTVSGGVLCYYEMEKKLGLSGYAIDYNNRIFSTVENTANGEVSEKTFFNYRQHKNIIWAEYSGGSVVRGFLLGTCSYEGILDFCYLHINSSSVLRTGKCRSFPAVLSDGRIRLNEEWEWTNGDKSAGKSVIEEVKQ